MDFNNFLAYKALPFPLITAAGYLVKSRYDADNFPTIEDMDAVPATAYSEVEGQSVLLPVKLNDTWLPNTLFSIQRSKRILESVVTGRKNTVKEQISATDYVIRVQGWVISNDHAYPLAKVDELAKLFDTDGALDIVNELLAKRGIHSVVVYDYDIPEVGRMENAQYYTVLLKSDDDFVADTVDLFLLDNDANNLSDNIA